MKAFLLQRRRLRVIRDDLVLQAIASELGSAIKTQCSQLKKP
jgi:hypothetical protein